MAIIARKPKRSTLFVDDVARNYIFACSFLRAESFSRAVFCAVCPTLCLMRSVTDCREGSDAEGEEGGGQGGESGGRLCSGGKCGRHGGVV